MASIESSSFKKAEMTMSKLIHTLHQVEKETVGMERGFSQAGGKAKSFQHEKLKDLNHDWACWKEEIERGKEGGSGSGTPSTATPKRTSRSTTWRTSTPGMTPKAPQQ